MLDRHSVAFSDNQINDIVHHSRPICMSLLVSRWQGWRLSQRALPLLVVLAAVTILGFYTTTDGSRLFSDHVLEAADYIGYSVCHRITDRSFSIAGRQLPLCARCTGMYLGVSLTFMVLALAGRQRWSRLPPSRVLFVLIGFIGVMGIDGLNSYSHFFPNIPHVYEPRNWLRLLTGIGAGLAMGSLVFPAMAQTLWKKQVYRPVLANLRELAGLVFLAVLMVGLVLSDDPRILYVLGLVSAAGVLLILTGINSTVMLILFRKDALASNWRQATVPLVAGLAIALVQIAAIAFVRFSATGTMTGIPGI
jgi:uncharacterized membrane protein